MSEINNSNEYLDSLALQDSLTIDSMLDGTNLATLVDLADAGNDLDNAELLLSAQAKLQTTGQLHLESLTDPRISYDLYYPGSEYPALEQGIVLFSKTTRPLIDSDSPFTSTNHIARNKLPEDAQSALDGHNAKLADAKSIAAEINAARDRSETEQKRLHQRYGRIATRDL